MLTAVVEYAAANWHRSCGLVYSMGAPGNEAGDIVNDAVVNCCETPDHEVRNVAGYWHVCLKNALADYIRKQTGERRDRPAIIVSDDFIRIERERKRSFAGDPEDEALAAELAKEIAGALTPGERRGLARYLATGTTGGSTERAALMHARIRVKKLLACA